MSPLGTFSSSNTASERPSSAARSRNFRVCSMPDPPAAKPRLDKAKYVHGIEENRPSAGEERRQPRLDNVMPALDADNFISLGSDDPRHFEDRDQALRQGPFEWMHLDVRSSEHIRKRSARTAHNACLHSFPSQSRQQFSKKLLSPCPFA